MVSELPPDVDEGDSGSEDEYNFTVEGLAGLGGVPAPALPINETKIVHMPAGTFDIILLVDRNQPLLFNEYPNGEVETTNLEVGSFLWIARSRVSDEELILPHIIERNKMDGFAAKIKDGSIDEQKYKLKHCGLAYLIYLIEDHPGMTYAGLSTAALEQAAKKADVKDRLFVHHSHSMIGTKQFLDIVNNRVKRIFKDVAIHGSDTDGFRKIDDLMTFDYFKAKAHKLYVKDVIYKMLVRLGSINNTPAAHKLYDIESIPDELIRIYDNCTDEQKRNFHI